MDGTELLVFGVIGLIIWIFILKAVIKSANKDVIRILELIAKNRAQQKTKFLEPQNPVMRFMPGIES
jgi:hypothetical protein